MSLGKLFGKIGDKFDKDEAPVVPAKFQATVYGFRYDSDEFFYREGNEYPALRDGDDVAIYRLEKVVKASVKVG